LIVSWSKRCGASKKSRSPSTGTKTNPGTLNFCVDFFNEGAGILNITGSLKYGQGGKPTNMFDQLLMNAQIAKHQLAAETNGDAAEVLKMPDGSMTIRVNTEARLGV
jgi:hypothetical protein